MAIKINIGVPSLKKTKQIELSDDQSKSLYDKRVGETIKGELVDLPGYQFEITGGSDNAGFPMRRDVRMSGRKKILITKSKGNRDTRAGRRSRKTVAGAIIYTGTAQVNLKTVKEGKQSLFEEPKAEEPAEAPAEAKSE
jgi:small subunit ribosomal protein S6e